MTKFFTKGRNGAAIDTVVLHFSSNVKANNQNPYDVDSVIKLYEVGKASAHYLIARDGKVYGLIREEDTAHHAGEGEWEKRKNNLNRYSIGIELLSIGTYKEMENILSRSEYEAIPKEHLGYTDAQYKALKQLIVDIRGRHPAIKNDRKHVIGHDEYAPKRKFDPGELFVWAKIGL